MNKWAFGSRCRRRSGDADGSPPPAPAIKRSPIVGPPARAERSPDVAARTGCGSRAAARSGISIDGVGARHLLSAAGGTLSGHSAGRARRQRRHRQRRRPRHDQRRQRRSPSTMHRPQRRHGRRWPATSPAPTTPGRGICVSTDSGGAFDFVRRHQEARHAAPATAFSSSGSSADDRAAPAAAWTSTRRPRQRRAQRPPAGGTIAVRRRRQHTSLTTGRRRDQHRDPHQHWRHRRDRSSELRVNNGASTSAVNAIVLNGIDQAP